VAPANRPDVSERTRPEQARSGKVPPPCRDLQTDAVAQVAGARNVASSAFRGRTTESVGGDAHNAREGVAGGACASDTRVCAADRAGRRHGAKHLPNCVDWRQPGGANDQTLRVQNMSGDAA